MTEPETPKDKPSTGATILLALGLLWMALSGLCTARIALPMLFSDYAFLGWIGLTVGALSFGIGWLIWRAGKGKR